MINGAADRAFEESECLPGSVGICDKGGSLDECAPFSKGDVVRRGGEDVEVPRRVA